jgi:Putative Flp pilus-assembly TadE/G-like
VTRPARQRDRGSILMLMPAGLLIVLVLASIAVDMSLVHLRKRQAFELAAAAANDAATAGVDQGRLRTTHDYVLDPERARAVVEDAVAASELAPQLARPPVVILTATGVRVELALEADYIFADVVPGAPDGTEVTASATATAVAAP